MAKRTRYKLERVEVFPVDSRPASWTFAGSPMRGTEHAYLVNDGNLGGTRQQADVQGEVRTRKLGGVGAKVAEKLEMARALMADPEVICLDEPMAGVNPALTQSLLQHVKELKKEGLTVIFVEHDMDVVRDISDWVVVMAEGSIIAEGSHASIGKNKAVIDAYLGTAHEIDLGTIELAPEDR